MVSKRYVVANSSKNINILSAFVLPAAEAGLALAQYYLAIMYEDGEGVEANLVKAIEWYKKGMLSRILQYNTLSALLLPAAEAGNRDAQCFFM
jgi:Sel1 repeat